MYSSVLPQKARLGRRLPDRWALRCLGSCSALSLLFLLLQRMTTLLAGVPRRGPPRAGGSGREQGGRVPRAWCSLPRGGFGWCLEREVAPFQLQGWDSRAAQSMGVPAGASCRGKRDFGNGAPVRLRPPTERPTRSGKPQKHPMVPSRGWTCHGRHEMPRASRAPFAKGSSPAVPAK